MTQHTTTLAAFASAASEAPAGVAAATVLAELALTQRELLTARQLIRLLCETLRERGEHPTSCEWGIIAGHECACGLDLAIQLACEAEPLPPPPERTPADLDAWIAARLAESSAARARIFGRSEVGS